MNLATTKYLYLFSFVETPRKFIVAIINLRGVSTKLNKYIVFTVQTYKKHVTKYLFAMHMLQQFRVIRDHLTQNAWQQ